MTQQIARLGLNEGPNALKPDDEIIVSIVPALDGTSPIRAAVGDHLQGRPHRPLPLAGRIGEAVSPAGDLPGAFERGTSRTGGRTDHGSGLMPFAPCSWPLATGDSYPAATFASLYSAAGIGRRSRQTNAIGRSPVCET